METIKKEQIIAFKSPEDWHAWLMANHTQPIGIWVRLYKKASGVKSINYDQALDEALCFGWIDGQKKSFDEKSWIQKFTPRRAKSLWSKRNRDHIARLVKAKRMQPAGLREVKNAKADGRWDQAYDSAKTMKIPEDFLKELKKDKSAYEFFLTLNKANVYAIAWRLQTAKKPETRERRMAAILDMLKNGKKLH